MVQCWVEGVGSILGRRYGSILGRRVVPFWEDQIDDSILGRRI